MTRNSLFTRTALSLVLGTGSILAAAPALAAPKPAPTSPAAPKIQFSPAFAKAAAELDKALGGATKNPAVTAAAEQVRAAGENAAARSAAVAQVDAALGGTVKARLDAAGVSASTPGDKLKLGELTRIYGVLTDDNALQYSGSVMMLDSGVLSPTSVGQVQWVAGVAAYRQRDYATAAKYVQLAKQSGFQDPQLNALLTDSYNRSNNSAGALQNAQQDIAAAKAAGRSPAETSIRTALKVAYDGKQAAASTDLSTMLVQYYPTKPAWTTAIGVIRTIGGYAPQETLDLMRLLLATNSLTDTRDYIDYIQAADPRRSPGEVLKVINMGTSSGKLKAGDLFVSEARTSAQGRITADQASLPKLERDARAGSASATFVTAAADAFLSYADYAKAADLFKLALTKPGIDSARAWTRLGIAQAMSGQYADAQASFGKVTGPRQPIAKLWAIYAVQKAGGAVAPAAAPTN